MRKIILSFVLFVLSGAAHTQTLWQNTEYGMTTAEVQAAVTGARPVKDGQELGNGLVEKLRVEKMEIFGRPFSVGMYFDGDSLSQVMLALQDKPTVTQANILYNQLAGAMQSKYGPEIPAENVETSMMRSKTWMNGKANISVTLLAAAGQLIGLNIAYQMRVSNEADKL